MTWRFDSDLDWMPAAACAGVDGDIFFAETGGPVPMSRLPCGTCPVATECRAYALSLDDAVFGTWGGWSARRLNTERSNRRSDRVNAR